MIALERSPTWQNRMEQSNSGLPPLKGHMLSSHQSPLTCCAPCLRLAATTHRPLIHITVLVPKVTVCIFCHRQHQILFLGQFRSSESCSLGRYVLASCRRSGTESWFGIMTTLFTDSHCNKLSLWMLKTLPLHFKVFFYLGSEVSYNFRIRG